MILTSEQMCEAEKGAFALGVDAGELMETAGSGIARLVDQFHPVPGTCYCFYGKGHNGGDALVAARILARSGWKIIERPAFPMPLLSPLSAGMQERLAGQITASTAAAPSSSVVVLDGLLGTGARPKPSGEIANAIREINTLRQERGAWVVSIDLPSGLDPLAGSPIEPTVQADATAMLGFAKAALLADEATAFVGRLALIPLDGISPAAGDPWQVSTAASFREPPYSFERHKGQAGRVALIAGSTGLTGAARLCSAAAARAGAGLVTLFVPEEIAAQLSAACIPEVMVLPCRDFREALDFPCAAIGIGPGLGRKRDAQVLSLVRESTVPTVVDADALNALSHDPGLLLKVKGERLLTPHPGEMERLMPRQGRSRRQWAEDFVERYPVTLLLKGARTLIVRANAAGFYNSTGHPGMASGGMGDVLTGVCTALAARNSSEMPLTAAEGAWLCGRAAERATTNPAETQESLLASDVIGQLGRAFGDLRLGAL